MSEEEYIQKAYERLHRKGTDEIVDYAYELEQELRAYKDKEDKLRELIDNYIHDDFGELSLDDILQILNEKEKVSDGE